MMAPQSLAIVAAQTYQPVTVKDYWVLMKPGVMVMIVYTGIVGALLAPAMLHPFQLCVGVLSLSVGSGAAALFNMWYDADIDALMARTQKRPIPAGRVTPQEALTLAWVLSIMSVMVMYVATNGKAALLLAFSIFYYAYVYTMALKRATDQNIVIGGAAGAFPPVIGWMMTGAPLAWEPLALFLIVFLWTPSHFWSLALYRSGDYGQARVPMLPNTRGVEVTQRHILLYSYAVVISSVLPLMLHFSLVTYPFIAGGLGILYLIFAHRLQAQASGERAIRLFLFSITYLFGLFSALAVDHLWIKGVTP
jgi:protoheme IX farnesyltransferase